MFEFEVHTLLYKYGLNKAAAGFIHSLNPDDYSRFSKGFQLSTNQMSWDSPLERAQTFYDIHIQEGTI